MFDAAVFLFGCLFLVGLIVMFNRTPRTRVVSTESGFWTYKGNITASGVPYVIGPEWEGATEEWSPKEEMTAASPDPWLDAMNEEDERFLLELDHAFIRLAMNDPDVDAEYELFVQRSMQLQAYRNLRLEHTQEIEVVQ